MNVGRLELEQALSAVGFSGPDAKVLIRAILGVLADTLVRGGTIQIRGFGTFYSYARKPHIGRNPRTGEAVPVPPHRKYFFKPSLDLLRRLNERGN